MSRGEEFKRNENPALFYGVYKSEDNQFSHYDKEAKTSDLVKLPYKFVVLSVAAGIKGWNEDTSTGIYSNIVVDTRKEAFQVKCGDKTIHKGLYADIKEAVKASGGHYEAKIFIWQNDKIVMLDVKGATLASWMKFQKKSRNSFENFYIEVKTVGKGKKGSVKYTFAEFSLGERIPKNEIADIDTAYDEVKAYLASAAEYAEDISEEKPQADVENSFIDDNDGDPETEEEKADDLEF